MFDEKYYKERKLKLLNRAEKDTRNFIASMFNFVDAQRDIQEQVLEIQAREKEDQKDKKKEEKKEKKK